ncbi:MAG: 23S rRNA (uracil(1939)-C(5))-methyltransferase RlmD [Lachnospiraceae bacterium]|nr:23S rRNA (uracil(1939)-C(5))-methyltransferase RlmD [Lachnospiraceae bacterium]
MIRKKQKQVPHTSGRNEKKRSKSRCSVFAKCGACSHIDVPYEEQLSIKQGSMIKLLNTFCYVDKIVGMDDPFHYRCKVNSVLLKRKDGSVVHGNYSEGTHRIVPIENCLIEDERADRLITDTAKLLGDFKIKIYNDRSDFGLVRYLMVRIGKFTGEMMLVIVTRSPIFPSKNNFIKALLKIHPEVKTVVQNVNSRSDSMVLGDRDIVMYGKGYITDELCGMKFRISPRSFYQVNPVQAEKIYKRAIELADLKGDEVVIDAYCGTGTIGLIAAAAAGRVIGVELNADAIRDAKKNAEINSVENIEFICDDSTKFLEDYAEKGGQADVVLLDPPRAGVGDALIETLKRVKPSRIVYVSCNPFSLERDLKKFTEDGEYTVKAITPYDMFPMTEHVEVVSLLERMTKRKPDTGISLSLDMGEYYDIIEKETMNRQKNE